MRIWGSYPSLASSSLSDAIKSAKKTLRVLLNHKSGRNLIKKMIPGTPGSQNIKQFIRFINPDTPHNTNAAGEQGIRQQTGCRPDNGDFSTRLSRR